MKETILILSPSHKYLFEEKILILIILQFNPKEFRMNKILCATDGTMVSEQAEIWAGKLAKKLGYKLVFLYVSGVGPEDVTNTIGDFVALDSVELKNHEVLSRCQKNIKDHALDANCIVLNKHDIAEGIVSYAQNENIDHIVTGSKHIGSFSSVFLGSVATEIIRRANCAVTVIRSDITK